MMKQKSCTHIDQALTVEVEHKNVCEECVKTGDSWVHLRTCIECGKTHCCDSSPNKHATKHAEAYDHPVVQSAEQGEAWMYCYPDKLFHT